MSGRYYIGKIGVSKVNLDTAVQHINESLLSNQTNYVCVTNSRTCYIANHDEYYCKIQNNSLLTVADGMSLVWIAHLNGFDDVGRVSGVDLMKRILENSDEKGYAHYFFGSTPDTIAEIGKRLKSTYPEIDVKGMVSPPFQPVEEFNIRKLADEINSLEPDFFWCGLGAPKQEKLMYLLQPLLKKTICIGVGLAFDYFVGNIKRAPKWMRNNGLEWIYRLAQQPKRINFKTIRALSAIIPYILKPVFKKSNP